MHLDSPGQTSLEKWARTAQLGLTARNVERFELWPAVSFCLIWAGLLFPLGFFLGGVVSYGGDEGLGIWLVPIAALMLFYSIARIALDLSKQRRTKS